MNLIVKKLFRIHEGEGRRVLHFAFLAACLQAGLAIGISSADSLFLVRVGADKLPIIYLITPLMMLAYIPVFSYLMGRFGVQRLLNITLGLLAVGGILLYAAMTPGVLPAGWMTESRVIYYVVKLYAGLWYIALYTLLWNFLDCYFDILDAKRLYSLLSGGGAVGTIIGGGLVTVLVRFLSVEQLFLVWSILALATFPVVASIRKNWKDLGGDEAEVEENRVSFLEQTGVILRVIRTSRYSNFMILAFLSTLMVTTVCEYQYMKVFETGRSAEQVAVLFGRLYVLVSCFNVLVNLFLFNRLVAWLGVRNTALIQPIVYAATFSYLLLDYGMGAAVAGFFAYQGILTSIEYNNQNFLFNALPSRGKAEMRTFIEGLCEPLATASAGLFLMFFAHRLSPQSVSVAGLAGATIALFSVLGLRAHYLVAIVENLKKTWLNFSRSHLGKLSGIHGPELHIVEALAASVNRDIALAAIRILTLNDRGTGLEALLAFIGKGSPEDQRAAAPFLAEALAGRDSEVFRRVLTWIEKAKATLDPLLLEECGRHNLLSDEDIRSLSASSHMARRSAAAVALWHSWKVDGNLECIRITKQLIEGTEEERVAAIRIIGKSGQSRYANFLASQLDATSLAIRREALASIARLVDEGSVRLLPDILRATARCSHHMRMDGLDALARIKSPDCVKPLAMMSERFTPFERRRAEAVVLGIGLPSVPILAALLKDPHCCLATKSIVSRSLGHLAFPQFEALAPALIQYQVTRAYAYLCAHWVLSQNPEGGRDLAFLSRYCQDAQASVVDSVLEILTISGRLPDYELMSASLHSANLKERGNAIETIEQGCGREIFVMLLPLLDIRPLRDKVDFYRRHFRAALPSIRDVVSAAIESNQQMEIAAGLQTAWRAANDPGREILDRNQVYVLMQKKLKDPSLDLVEDVIFSLLASKYRDGETGGLTVVDKMDLLSRTEFFGALGVPQLEWMVRSVEVRESVAGQVLFRAGEPAGSAFVVVAGTVLVREGTISKPVGERGLLGAETVRGEKVYRTEALSKGATILAIPRDVIEEAAEADPHIAIGMLAYKLGAGREPVAAGV